MENLSFAYLNQPADNNSMDIDILNAFRLLDHGFNVNTPVNDSMSDAMYNALQFAQHNDMSQFVNTDEAHEASAEQHISESHIIHVGHHSPMIHMFML